MGINLQSCRRCKGYFLLLDGGSKEFCSVRCQREYEELQRQKEAQGDLSKGEKVLAAMRSYY